MWEVNNNLISKEEALRKIQELAREQGIEKKVAFKVFYDGVQIDGPSSLPAEVDFSLIRISSTFNQG